ncbi:unnamed protein product [Adineta steineri]|uniref:Uncharacterized protein n=1 Tax=Adineta steineri TaxID=433720 RepID=A0A814MTN0_9BILA|nr:unnamed protein product [Adineta steineri]CAF1081006.1 unnamed protein product [Adineta steineri]
MNTIKCFCLEWSFTGNMHIARRDHTASVLSNGKVLVAGAMGAEKSTELYDPSTSTWTTTGNMNNIRVDHTASLLSNGKVLVTGGLAFNVLNSAELYDPSAGTWTNTGIMNNVRRMHTASVLSNGKVLVAGGNNGGWINYLLNSTELYDPSTGVWTTTGSMTNARHFHTASVLSNGNVLVTGGWNGNITMYSAELYDPSTGTWTTTGNMNNARSGHSASLLSNGKILVAGGAGAYNILGLNSAELY